MGSAADNKDVVAIAAIQQIFGVIIILSGSLAAGFIICVKNIIAGFAVDFLIAAMPLDDVVACAGIVN